MIDAHCHIDLYPDPVEVAQKCEKVGLRGIAVTTTPSAWRISSAIVRRHCNLAPALGLHPQVAHDRVGELKIFDQRLPETDFVGEIGLDGASEYRATWKTQVLVFTHILDSCSKFGGKILSIHSRRAAAPVLDALEDFRGAGTPIFHWFSGSVSQLDRAIAMDGWFSVGPAMLSSKNGQRLAELMPPNRILTETDGPFAQIGSRSLVPWDASSAVASLAKMSNQSEDITQAQITRNFDELISTHRGGA